MYLKETVRGDGMVQDRNQCRATVMNFRVPFLDGLNDYQLLKKDCST
jgi:hypothetical protein